MGSVSADRPRHCVRRDVWGHAISGILVVRKWLGWRTRTGVGNATRAGHELEQIRRDTWPAAWSDEFLDLLRVLTHPRPAPA